MRYWKPKSKVKKIQIAGRVIKEKTVPGRKLIITPGDRFNGLTIFKEVLPSPRIPSGQITRTFLCKCDCGKEKQVKLSHLKNNKIKSCGCIGGESHGLSKDKLYRVWTGMKNRVHNDTCIDAHRYKQRGITICDQWDDSFSSFKDWALENGYKKGLQIDRIDNSKGYSPENCRFVTPIENCNNRDVTFKINYNNQHLSLSLLLHEKGKHENYNAILGRIKRGWDHTKAVETPIRTGNYKKKCTE